MRFKSVIWAFVFLTVTSLVALAVFVQTKSFGGLITKVVSDISEKKAHMKVGISSIGVSLFPPGIELHRIRVEKEFSPDKKLFTELGKLGFYIGLIEIEERKLTLGEIRISDAAIDFIHPEDEKEEELKELDRELINKIFDFSSQMPVRVDTVLIENAKVFVNHDLIEVKRLKLFKKDDGFMTRFHLANLRPLADKDITVDELWGDIEIGRNNAEIYRLKVQHDVQTVTVKGKIADYPLLKKAKAELSGEAFIHLHNLKDDFPMPKMVVLDGGLAHLKYNVTMRDFKFDGNADISLEKLRSNFVHADKLSLSLKMNDDKIQLKTLDLSFKDEHLKLLKSALVADLRTEKVLIEPLDVEVKNFSLGNALRFLGPSLGPLKGQLTGKMNFQYKGGNFYFTPENGFHVRHLGLITSGKKPFTVLMIKDAKLSHSSFRIVGSEFQMDSDIEMHKSNLKVHGFVNSKQVEFSSTKAIVNFEDLGNVSQLDLKGQAKIDISVSGPLSDTVIDFTGTSQNFEVLGYKFGTATKDISISLKDSSVVIHKLDAKYGDTQLSGSGDINYGNLDIALGVTSPSANFQDLKDILAPIFSKLTFLPKDFDLNARIDAHVYGKTKLDDLRIKSNVKFNDLTAYGETLPSGEFDIKMLNRRVEINDLRTGFGRGKIIGDFSYSLATEKMKLDYSWDNLPLSGLNALKKFNVALDGTLDGSFTGDGTSKDYVFHLQGKIDNTRSHEHRFDDSFFEFKITPSHFLGSANFLGNILDTDIDYSLNRANSSKIKLSLNVPDIKPVAMIFLGQHLDDENFNGKFKFDLDTKFEGDFHHLDLKANLSSLNFNHDAFKVNYSSDAPQFVVSDGHIQRWNLDIRQPDLSMVSKGQGTFGKSVSLIQDIDFNSKFLELMLSSVLSAEGTIKNRIRVEGQGNKYSFSLNSQADGLDLTLDSVPFPLNNVNYLVEFSNKRLYIQKLNSNLDTGQVFLNGDVYFDQETPAINVKYVLDKAEIPVLGKSSVNISGEGIVLGDRPPYNVTGDLVVNKAQIVNELSEFNSKSNALAQVRFLPKSQESALSKLMNFNVNVKAENPMRISNSLMDVALKGEVRVLGGISRLRGEGHLYAPTNSSRVFFKNNEYFITNADLNFSQKKEISNPDFDVQAMTVISTYKVYAKAYGDLERFTFDLTSDPALSRKSILSLIAFGYTDEIQNTLSQGEQQNLTQMGVGSFVFDRFKISDVLNKQFGLQVNLGTVLEQSQTDSLIGGRTQEGQSGSLGRTRSATKIELKKRLDEALSLSVSSTMGGSIGQRQNMTLNYALTKKVQVEGIYELRTNAEGEEDIIDNSIGADLKFRWTFK